MTKKKKLERKRKTHSDLSFLNLFITSNHLSDIGSAFDGFIKEITIPPFFLPGGSMGTWD
jgi:hypothetical protein